jgi:hypothetical protein
MRWWLLAALVMGCGGDGGTTDEGCFSDDECGTNLVCDRAAATCVAPPGDCNGYCVMLSSCGLEVMDECIKQTCGASFLQYYSDTYGDDCGLAWLDLFECESNLTCDEYEQLTDEIDVDAGISPYCQTELQAKNGDC